MALIRSILVFKMLIQINLNLRSTIQFPPKLSACLFVIYNFKNLVGWRIGQFGMHPTGFHLIF